MANNGLFFLQALRAETVSSKSVLDSCLLLLQHGRADSAEAVQRLQTIGAVAASQDGRGAPQAFIFPFFSAW